MKIVCYLFFYVDLSKESEQLILWSHWGLFLIPFFENDIPMGIGGVVATQNKI
jgi:hypothetical protein